MVQRITGKDGGDNMRWWCTSCCKTVNEQMHETVGNRDIRRSVERRGMWRGTRGKQDVHHRDFEGGGFGMDSWG